MQSSQYELKPEPGHAAVVRPAAVFLAAEWRHLLMLNYSIDPSIVQAFVPHGTELDFFHGETFVSVVGFQFRKTKVRGIPVPFHRNFEEVNLRFYVRRRVAGGWRRGVVFIRELVPRRAIAFVARAFYGEPYLALPMSHLVERTSEGIKVRYAWQRKGDRESISAFAAGDSKPIADASLEQFITEHYWGYTARGAGCSEYEVEHPVWRIWPAERPELKADVEELYGKVFVAPLRGQMSSAFIADGSAVIVRRGQRVPV